MNNSEKFFASPEKFTQVHLRGIVTEPTIYIVHINVFAKFYEIPSMILQDIKETKR